MIGLLVGAMTGLVSLTIFDSPDAVAFAHGTLAALLVYVVESIRPAIGHGQFVLGCITDGPAEHDSWFKYLMFILTMAGLRFLYGMRRSVLQFAGAALLFFSVGGVSQIGEASLILMIPGAILLLMSMLQKPYPRVHA